MSSNRLRAASRRRLALGFAAASAALLPLGCGHAGPPHPPLRALPAAASDLAVRQRGALVLIDLAYPQTTAAGKSLAGVSAIEIWDAVRPVTSTPPATPDAIDPRLYGSQAKRKQRLGTAKEVGAATEGPRIELTVDLPKPLPTVPDAHFFTVKTVGVQNDASAFSNQGVLVPKTPPDPPTSMDLTPRANGILIEWEPAPPRPTPPPPPPPPPTTTATKPATGKTTTAKTTPPATPASKPAASATPSPTSGATPPAAASAPAATATPAPAGAASTATAPAATTAPATTTPPAPAGSVSTSPATPATPGATAPAAAPAPALPEPPLTAGGYYLYRRSAQEKRYPFKPLAVVRKRIHEYLDASAVFGQSYIYTVTQIDERDLQVESAIGKEQEIKYVDKYPPPVPTELVGVAESSTRVRLVWRPSEAPDLAGYLVYRLTGDEGWKKLTDKAVTSPSYIDTTVTAGQTYQYRVTAIDTTGNESQPTDIVRLTTPTG